MGHTLFSRDAYIAIGTVLRKEYRRKTGKSGGAEVSRRLTIRRMAYMLADMFQEDNKGFERNRFMDYTGVYDSILNEEEDNDEQTTS